MEKHYVKYLAIVVVFLFFLFGSYLSALKYSKTQLSPTQTGSAFVGNSLVNFYVNLTPLLSGILIVVALALLVLIVVGRRT